MKLITKQDILNIIPDAWARQYKNSTNSKHIEITTKLKEEINLTEEMINEIIGNSSWTSLKCDECKKEVNNVIQLGEKPNYESNTANVCFECLNKALNFQNDKERI